MVLPEESKMSRTDEVHRITENVYKVVLEVINKSLVSVGCIAVVKSAVRIADPFFCCWPSSMMRLHSFGCIYCYVGVMIRTIVKIFCNVFSPDG